MAIRSLFQQGIHTITSTGTQDNVSINDCGMVRLNNASDLTITGFAAGQPGQLLTLYSVGAGNVYLAPENTGSSEANRLITFLQVGNTPLAAGKGLATLQYDGTSARWRLLTHEQGAAISQPYSAGDFTASGTMTWTVASGDVGGYSYYIRGRTLFFTAQFDTTSVTAPLSTQLRFTVPGNFVINQATQGFAFVIDNGTFTTGRWYSGGAGVLYITVEKTSGANWQASVNTTYMAMEGFFEVQ